MKWLTRILYFILILAIFIALFILIELRNYDGNIHYGGLRIIRFTVIYVASYLMVYITLHQVIFLFKDKIIRKVLFISLLMLFPTIRSEKYAITESIGESKIEYLPLDCDDDFCKDSNKYFRLGSYIGSIFDLFTMKDCGLVYNRGHKKGMEYCKKYFSLYNFKHLGDSLCFIVNLYSILITTILSIFIYKWTFNQ